MTQEDSRLGNLRSAVEYVVSKRVSCFLYEGHEAVAMILGLTKMYFTLPPTDVSKFEASQLSVSDPGGSKEKQ